MQSGRVLKLLLPGLGLRASILTKATAAGTDFAKVRGEAPWGRWVGRWQEEWVWTSGSSEVGPRAGPGPCGCEPCLPWLRSLSPIRPLT
jgi:hypothetical protein